MDPNSDHQLWSRWTAIVRVPFHKAHLTSEFSAEMRNATASFYRELFGSASEMKIEHEVLPDIGQSRFTVQLRTEGAPAPDMDFRRMQKQAIGEFFGKNLRRYGKVHVHLDIFVEAGDIGDGKPRAQVILGPDAALLPRVSLMGSHR